MNKVATELKNYYMCEAYVQQMSDEQREAVKCMIDYIVNEPCEDAYMNAVAIAATVETSGHK